MSIFLFIIGIIILAGLFNPWTGLFGNTLYSPKRKIEPEEPKKPNHQNFRLTKGY